MAQKSPSPKHGTTNEPANIPSESQADGSAAEAPRGETQAQPSGVGTTPATTGGGARQVRSAPPENREGRINPSAPADATEGGESTTPEMRPKRDDSLTDSAGEIGGADIHKLGHRTVSSAAAEAERKATESSPTSERPGKEGAGELREESDEEAA
jgi:hypothetical protein